MSSKKTIPATGMVFVSSGLLRPKKGDAAVYRRQRYLNYGMLSLANSHMVPTASVLHGHFDPPIETLDRISTTMALTRDAVFLISCPSFLSLEWTKAFVDLAANRYPQSRFILGGRWVVDGNEKQIRSLIPRIDYMCCGLGEGHISKLLKSTIGLDFWRSSEADAIYATTKLSSLDYTKLFEPQDFVPSFEGSRGCGAGCVFCAEATVPLTKLKPPEILCAEIERYVRDVANPVRRFYLETSNFTPRLDWIDRFKLERVRRGLDDILWRTEARVDIFSEKSIVALAQAGLKVLDLGLESASNRQLLAMGKTRDPAAYLKRCSRLLRMASECGILVKVNVLLFPGENYESVYQTVSWLSEHKQYFAGVSAFPTVYYGFRPDVDVIVEKYRTFGATLQPQKESSGIFDINLSVEIPHPESEHLARSISRQFMTADQYFTLKSFSYFDPRYSRSEFLEDISGVPPDHLTFRVNGGEVPTQIRES